jgi:hypothetical protein
MATRFMIVPNLIGPDPYSDGMLTVMEAFKRHRDKVYWAAGAELIREYAAKVWRS